MWLWLRHLFLEAYRFCAAVAIDIYQEPLLPDFLGDFFVELEYIFADIATTFYEVDQAWDDFWDEISEFLDWGEIYQHITGWIPNIEEIRDWFYNWWNNVLTVVYEWWHDITLEVQSWIEQGDAFLHGLIDSVEGWLSDLQNEFDTFVAGLPDLTAIGEWFSDWWGNILAELDIWWNDRLADIQGLIDSAFANWSPFWEGWIEVKDSVVEFVCDPLEWLWGRFADWFLGPER